MIDSIKPKNLQIVYDLVRQAGLDVSDWSNYKRPESPQTNPKYCYEWAFVGSDSVVVCLWFDAMEEDESGIFQPLNYRMNSRENAGEDATVVRRRKTVDRVLSTAFEKQLTVRVIVVDGSADHEGARRVDLRSLDSEPWLVASYDEGTGSCRVQRGAGSQASSSPSDPVSPSAPSISMIRFQAELENLKEHLLEFDGVPFESFIGGKLEIWEGYKDYVFNEARARLQWSAWKTKEVGTGAILDRVIHAIEIDDGKKKRNNLLQWKKYGVHRILSEVRNDRRCFQLESLLFDFYTGELEPEEAFDSLVAELGKKYPLIAYLFFIRDCSRFLPIAPETFDSLFERLGVNLKTNGRCGWDNYAAFLSVIGEVRQLLEIDGIKGVRLLDAHSFCWLLASLEPAAETSVRIATIEEVESLPGMSAGKPLPHIDWEALHRARALLGRRGEELALTSERDRLIRAGHPDLAERVNLVCDDHTKGYDLHSFETNGSDRLIEVKTMAEDGASIRFFTTWRQLELAHSGANHFYYLVLGARSPKPRIAAIRAHNIPAESINPIVHEVVLEGDIGQVSPLAMFDSLRAESCLDSES